MTPSEYREKYSDKAVTWKDLSGKIAISHFRKNYPELKKADVDLALDFCFTHNPLVYAEDIVGITVGDVEILTLGDTEVLEHFIYVADYDSGEASINLVCPREEDAVLYVKLLSENQNLQFTIHKPVSDEWELFDGEAAKLGLTCRYGYDMIYPENDIEVPQYANMTVRELSAGDMPLIWKFRKNGGCADCHVRGLQAAFDGKGNMGERGFGLFINGEMVCLATPVLDEIRDMKKYDIGAIFAVNQGRGAEAIEMIWKYVISECIKTGARIGNAYALENAGDSWEKNSPLGVETSERIGLIKIAKNCSYSK